MKVTASLTPLVVLVLAGCAHPVVDTSKGEGEGGGVVTGVVVSVADGDTVTVEADGRRERVRLLGIDAPELGHESGASKSAVPAECGAQSARAALVETVMGQVVRVSSDDPHVASRDRFGRLLGYVETATGDVGERQVRSGWAEAWAPLTADRPGRMARYEDAQRQARAERAGAWRTCTKVGR